MPIFVDVAAVRIQRYLDRWPSLRGRRGASAMISAWGGGSEDLAIVLRDDATVNGAAGLVDGLLSLELRPGKGSEVAEVVASRAMRWVRDRAPALELQAAWAEGTTYIDAFPMIQSRLADGQGRVGLPPTLEFPPGLSCELCQQDHAVATLRLSLTGRDGRPEEIERRCCQDCRERERSQSRHSVEWELAEKLSHGRRVATLTELAQLLPTGKRNHLGTVAVDGNGLGAFFNALSRESGSAKNALSREVTAAMRGALQDAANSIPKGMDGSLAVIPHVLGGDDLLATVPAPHAWRFARTLIRGFGERTRSAVQRHAPGLLPNAPSASAGLVIAHEGHPFDRCQSLAHDLLDDAKRAHGGAHAAIRWVDVTRDGERPPATRRAWTLAELDGQEAPIAALARLGQSAQHELARALIRAPVGAETEAVRGAARRLGHLQLVTPFLRGQDACRLADALDIARWWS